jgi:penicillin-binding protein 2
VNTITVEPQHDRDQGSRLLHDDTRFAAGKIAFFQYLTVAVFVFLVIAFWDLQIRNPEFYSEQALRNSYKAIPVLAARGKILDRDGRVIVDNTPSYSLLLNRQVLKYEHLKPIADGLGLDYDDLAARVRRFESRPKYTPIIIKSDLSTADRAFVESHRDPSTFPEMELLHADHRLYPHDGIAAHVIGYVGEVSEQELNSPEFANYNQGDIIGKFGVERQYNDILTGVDGQRQVMVDSFGRERGEVAYKEAVPGKPLQLTLDLDLQAVAELAMEGKRGAVVALDPRTGDVLAMVSQPSFDPNEFAGHIKAADWKEIVENPHNPLLNRAIQAQLAPGSTFKPIMALAGLETGTIDEEWSVSCSGGASFYGRYFKCHKKGGHGKVSLHKAIAQSCDVYFYNVGNKMGIDNIAKYAEMAGLGRKTGIDLPNEATGIVPSTRWKLRNFRQKWYAGETISVSIGQGYTTVTPLQLAHAIGGIAMGGVWVKPHVLRGTKVESDRGNVNPENVEKVVYGMWAVVNEGGTATVARIPGIDVCGKTGTAQLASNDLLKAKKGDKNMKDNAWFVGFAPRQSPEIVVVALFENGEHGNYAAPIVRDVIKSYFDKKARMAAKQVASFPLVPQPLAFLLNPVQIREERE